MKKFISYAATLILTFAILSVLSIFMTVTALELEIVTPIGTPLGDVLYSDITAYINGEAIPTSVINGKTLVVAEDLAKYGFDVVWNNSDRTLKIELNKNKKITPLSVEMLPQEKKSGDFKCKYVYTDIKTYLSGEEIESYAINGVTLIDFELLKKYGKIIWDNKTRELRLVMTEDYFENSGEWVNFDIVREIINNIDKETGEHFNERVFFDKSRQTVHLVLDARHDWDIPTFVFGDTIYVKRYRINNYFGIHGIPYIYTPEEIAEIEAMQKEYYDNPDMFISMDILFEVLNSDSTKELKISYTSDEYSEDIFGNCVIMRIFYDADGYFAKEPEILGKIKLFFIEETNYVRKSDINPYLIKYDYETQ